MILFEDPVKKNLKKLLYNTNCLDQWQDKKSNVLESAPHDLEVPHSTSTSCLPSLSLNTPVVCK
jgi:hypothetical protein